MDSIYTFFYSGFHKIYGLFQKLHPYLRTLILLLLSVGVVGFLVFFLVFLTIFFVDETYKLPLCFGNKCLLNFYDYYLSAFNVARGTLELIVLVATVGAIFIALLSYLSTLKTSHFTNHVAHLTLFQSFFVEEVKKRDMLSLSSFDAHKIYGLIYAGSRRGDMSISEGYYEFVGVVNGVILESNFNSFKATKGPFIYKDHQAEMIKALDGIGFDLQFMPKKDFYEIETQIVSLIDAISNSFCGGSSRAIIVKRMYR